MKKTIEKRFADFSSTDTDLAVEGYAVVFNSPTLIFTDLDGIDRYEVIDAGAFDNCNMTDVVFRYNHSEDNQILARTTNNTLQLIIDDHGLKVKADLAPTNAGKDIYTLIKRKDLSKMSYAFTVKSDYFETEDTKITRHITAIDKLYDVSVVDSPAYSDTEIEIVKRSFSKLKENATIDADKRKRLYIASMF